jgi:hypothetical protein
MFFPFPSKLRLLRHYSLILPILDTADITYLDLTEDQLNKLKRIQNVCIQFMFGLRKYDHVSYFHSQLV